MFPHTDDPSLLAAICQQPDDDHLRLVYADWLDDHGDETRAEFVRLQCANPIELSPHWPLTSDWHHGYGSLTLAERKQNPSLARQLDLYKSQVRKWNGAIHRRLRHGPLHRQADSRRGLIRGWSYRRGFPCTLWADIQALAHFPEEVRRIGPIERLNLFGSLPSGVFARVVKALASFRLRILDLQQVGLPGTDRELLLKRASFPGLARLERLLS